MNNTKKTSETAVGHAYDDTGLKLIHGWHEPLRSYMRLYQPNGGEGIYRIHIRRIIREEAAK